MSYTPWENLSESQQREIRTACVFVALGPVIRSNISAIANAIQAPVKEELARLERQPEADKEYLKILKEVSSVPASLDGIKRLENLSTSIPNPKLLALMKKGWERLPSVMQFTGFASLLQHNAVSKFISFALGWRYTGKGYHAPAGMSAPFSGYDDIINSLMGHPRCKAEMEKQAKIWKEISGNN